jgi:beta-phosphoglucomutase
VIGQVGPLVYTVFLDEKDMSATRQSMGVIFDLDGVVVDTGEFHKQAWFDLARKEGFEISEEFFLNIFGMQNYQILPILAGRDVSGEMLKELSEWKESRYRDLIKGKVKLMDGVLSLVADLKKHGFLLAVGTSTPRVNLDFILENLQVDGYFDACVAGEDAAKGKPAPDTFLRAAAKLGLSPRCCVVVEDAIAGVEAGKSAGMAVVAVTSTRKRGQLQRADVIVDSLAELKAEDFMRLVSK